jgi:hypothetical protein
VGTAHRALQQVVGAVRPVDAALQGLEARSAGQQITYAVTVTTRAGSPRSMLALRKWWGQEPGLGPPRFL